MTKYGYCRTVIEDGKNLAIQEKLMEEELCDEIYSEVSSGISLKQSVVLDNLLQRLEEGDILVVSSLDCFSRKLDVTHGILMELFEKNIELHSLDTGILDDDFTWRIFLNGFESAMRLKRKFHAERLEKSRIAAKLEGVPSGGRARKYTVEELNHAMKLLETKSFNQVVKETNISRSTLLRESKRRKELLYSELNYKAKTLPDE